MHLTLLLLHFLLNIDNRFVSSSVSPSSGSSLTTTTTEINELQDGHPNHELWRKVAESGHGNNSDGYVIEKMVSWSFARSFDVDSCRLIKLISSEKWWLTGRRRQWASIRVLNDHLVMSSVPRLWQETYWKNRTIEHNGEKHHWVERED